MGEGRGGEGSVTVASHSPPPFCSSQAIRVKVEYVYTMYTLPPFNCFFLILVSLLINAGNTDIMSHVRIIFRFKNTK